jgi:hypothetical protein
MPSALGRDGAPKKERGMAIVDLIVPIETVKSGKHAAIVDAVGGGLPPSL